MGMWSPVGDLISGATPRSSSQEEESPIISTMGMPASCQGTEDLGDQGEVGSWPLNKELKCFFLVEMKLSFLSARLWK